jgi:class 3 adenylate cyclase
VAARLASAAGPGELLVSLDAAHAARFERDVTERRDLDLKGKSDPVPVLVLRS